MARFEIPILDIPVAKAATDGGRRMIWRISILKQNLKMIAEDRQPHHLSFPATLWTRLPALPKAE